MSGRHLRFPFRIAQDGRPESPADLADHVRGEVIQLLLTNPGERDFQPSFGGGLKRLVFEAADDVTAALARARITKALNFWLGERLEVKALDARAEGTTLTVDLVYRVRASDETRRLRFEHDMRTLGDG
jgi:phage baseplate assembly protein W